MASLIPLKPFERDLLEVQNHVARSCRARLRPMRGARFVLVVLLGFSAALGARSDARADSAQAPAARSKREVARDPKTPEATLWQLSHDADPEVRGAVGANPSTSEATLWRLSHDAEAAVRAAAATHASTAGHVLEKLADDVQPQVRSAVARNANTTEQVVWRLGKDRDARVRKAVVESPNTRLTSHAARLQLINLAVDADVEVRLAVARNPHLLAALMLLSHDTDARVRSTVAVNPTTSEPFLWKLSKDPDAGVRSAAARNPKTAAALRDPEKMEKAYLEYQQRAARRK